MDRFHIHLVSDATGETLNAIAKAALAQFEGVVVHEHSYALVRSQPFATESENRSGRVGRRRIARLEHNERLRYREARAHAVIAAVICWAVILSFVALGRGNVSWLPMGWAPA